MALPLFYFFGAPYNISTSSLVPVVQDTVPDVPLFDVPCVLSAVPYDFVGVPNPFVFLL